METRAENIEKRGGERPNIPDFDAVVQELGTDGNQLPLKLVDDVETKAKEFL